MGFPRDYLDFTLWYLQKKGYVAKSDNAQYTLSVDGVDFVETQRANMPTLNKLLTNGSKSTVEDTARPQHGEAPAAASGPTAVPSKPRQQKDRRLGRPDRRVGEPDLRDNKVERRIRQQEWREESTA